MAPKKCLEVALAAEIVSTHGIRGAVKALRFTDSLREAKSIEFAWVISEYFGIQRVAVEEASFEGGGIFLKFSSCCRVEEARKMIGSRIAMEIPLAENGNYHIRDLIGLKVFEESGSFLGFLKSVYSTPANDVYEIRPEKGTGFLIPSIKQVVTKIDLDRGTMWVKLIPGLGPEK